MKYGSFKYSAAKYGITADATTGDPVGWTETAGGNHGGDDWLVDADTVIAGVHRNVGRLWIAPGVLVNVAAYDGSSFGELEVHAHSIDLEGALVSSTFGYRGGAATAAGEGPFGGAAGVDGGYLAGAGQGDSTTDTSAVKGSGGGGGTTQPGGAGGGLIRLFARAALHIAATAAVFAHGAPEGEASAGNGAGGGIVLHCDGPFGLQVASGAQIGTLGGATLTADGGTVKEFALAGRLSVAGTVNAGRTYSNTSSQRAAVVA